MLGYKVVFRSLAFLLAGVVFLAAAAHAQNIFGSIVGTVSDPSGAVLAGAQVTVSNLATGEKRTVSTDSQGSYNILSLSRGQYRIEVDAHGFKHYSRSPIEVVVNQSPRVDVSMAIGEQSQLITVTAAAPIMQTESSSLGQAVEGKAVTNLPLNGRNVLALVALVPGVVPQGSSAGNLTGQNVFAAGNYQISGGNANQGSVLVDGAPVNTSYGNTVELVMSQDVIQEFNAQTHNNTAEFGMYTGGVINMSTKQGSNAFHGTAYEFLRNTVLDANDFFSNRNKLGRNPWHQNQFGFNVGGPIKRDKYFAFFDYQGYRESHGRLFFGNTPTAKELSGDFSAIPQKIYDPLTYDPITKTRQQFSYNNVMNVIPPSRFSNVAKAMIAFPYFAKPNLPGSDAAGTLNNWSAQSKAGGTNDQYTIRADQNISERQTAFERYTHWTSKNRPSDPIGNGIIAGDPGSPEIFTTQQLVVGDTFVFNPTSVADIHLSFLRWNYWRNPGNLGYDSTKLGFPSYMGQISALNNLPKSSGIPRMSLSNPNMTVSGTGYIFSINNNYVIGSTYQKIVKRHTFKAGIDLRRLEMNYFQNNNPGGVFTFDNLFTASAPTDNSTGNPVASFLLGYVSSSTAQTVQIAPPTFQTLFYQGYFAQDTWQITNKLTLNAGIRWEVPGVYVERHNWASTFNPTETNPIVGVPGAFDLVATSQHPDRGVRSENYNNWSPRFGIAYRLNDKTVLRTGWGKFVIPADLQFPEAPLQAGINYLNNVMVNTQDGQLTPFNTLDNPYPGGLVGAPHRDPSYQQTLLGGNAQALNASEPNGKTYQWNVAVQREFPLGIALEAAYSGLRGVNLPTSHPINMLADSVMAKAAADPNCSPTINTKTCFLTQQIPNPFKGQISQGVLKYDTVTQNQLLRPFPQYGNLSNSGNYIGVSNYNALEMKLQKRMSNGGQVLGSYTYSKLLTDAEYLTSWLDSTSTAGWQNYNIPMSNYSLSSFDARQRLVVSYLYPLPIGKGQMLLPNLRGFANGLIGGWGLDGITTFQMGYPLGLTMQTNPNSTYAFSGTLRPNYNPSAPGCNGAKTSSGPMTTRINGYFNKACFVAPAAFTYGNQSRTDSVLRTPGQANWDMALFKSIDFREKAALELRLEAFNLFNRVQFGNPNTSIGNAQAGTITSQYNLPRIFQVSGRINF